MSGVRKTAATKNSAATFSNCAGCFPDGSTFHLVWFQTHPHLMRFGHSGPAFCHLAHTFLITHEASRHALLLVPTPEDARA
jgi:hypothetical protein